MEPVIRLENVSMLYGNNGTQTEALRGVSMRFDREEFAGITGESGSGKSTLLAILGGLQLPTSGTAEIRGFPLATLSPDRLADLRRETIGFIFQAYHLLPYLTARENVMVPMSPSPGRTKEKAERADLIAMTTHGRSGLRRVVFGSVAEAVLRTAPVPVLMIRMTAQAVASTEAGTR